MLKSRLIAGLALGSVSLEQFAELCSVQTYGLSLVWRAHGFARAWLCAQNRDRVTLKDMPVQSPWQLT